MLSMKNLDDLDLAKADDALAAALRDADDDDGLRAIVELEASPSDDTPAPAPVRASDYTSRTTYRKALLDQRQQQLELSLGPTVEAIKRLGIEALGSKAASKTLVVQGPARTIAQMLEVSRVKAASLDRRLDLRLGRPTSED